jgi:hypothetical protein
LRGKKHTRCPEIEKVQPYLDDLLQPEKATLFRRHLDNCSQCQEEFESLKQVNDVLQSAAREPVPKLDASRVRERLFGGRRRAAHLRPALAFAGAAVLVTACLVIVLYWMHGMRPQQIERLGGTSVAKPNRQETVAVIQPDEHITLVPLAGGRVTHRSLPDGGTAVRLTTGALFVRLERPLAGRFMVETPAGEVEATGTLFLVRVIDKKSTAVCLLQGTLLTRSLQGPLGSMVAPAFSVLCPAIRTADLEPLARPGRPNVQLALKQPRHEKPLAAVRRLLAERKIEPALAELSSYLARRPDNPRAVFLLGDARRLGKQPAQALEAYQRAIRLGKDPRLAEAALYQIGLLQLHDLAQPAEALRTFKQLVRDYPHGLLVQESFYHLAECRIAMKDFQGAMRLLDEYLGKYPRGTKAAEARTLLRAFEEKGWR